MKQILAKNDFLFTILDVSKQSSSKIKKWISS